MTKKETADMIVPIRIPGELRAAMDEAIYALSAPGNMVNRADFIRAAIQEKTDRALSTTKRGKKSGDSSKAS